MVKLWLALTGFSLICFTGIACSTKTVGNGATAASRTVNAVYHTLSSDEAKTLLDSSSPPTLVDVRTSAEYAERHIPNAILIPNETIKDVPPKELPDPDAQILVYCRTGVRSRQAANKLVAMGYTRVYDIGGISSWPYETVAGN